jgi:FkbM family methyltransferase
MEGLVYNAPMTDLLRQRGVFDRHPFVLIDVGCAGGIDEAWRSFGSSLVAHGYDPHIPACEEAQAREPFPHVRYHSRSVGLGESHPFVERCREEAGRWPNTNPWWRITAGDLAARLQRADAGDGKGAARRADPSTLIDVDEIVREEGLATVDFLKVDVDGPDLEVLESAREALNEKGVLGVGLEVNWFGSASPTEHTFHNTDLFLRQQGYALFGVSVRPYSRVALPAPFLYEFYAQTSFGQPFQGDAVYARDLAAPYEQDLAAKYPAEKLIKLACLYELIGLPDCAAEMLNRFRSRLNAFGEIEPLLDALTPPLLGKVMTYRQYIATYEREPHLFLPSAQADAAGVSTDDSGQRDREYPVVRDSPLRRLARRTKQILTLSDRPNR